MAKKRTVALCFILAITVLTLSSINAGCRSNLVINETDINKLPVSSVSVKIDQILEKPAPRPDLGDTELREFDIYLERPDKGLKEEDWIGKNNNSTSGLPLALQPKLLLVSEITDNVRDSGNSCDSFRVFPHRFHLTIRAENKQAKKVLLKAVFGDNTYAQTEITVPYVGMLDEPVVLEPTSAPKNGDRFQIKFKDVGASNYLVNMNIGHPYAGNGINPYLKGIELDLAREKGGFSVSYPRYAAAPNIGLIVRAENNTIELKSESLFTYSESGGPFDLAKNDTSVLYRIVATAEGMTGEGIKTYIESRYHVEYQLK